MKSIISYFGSPLFKAKLKAFGYHPIRFISSHASSLWYDTKRFFFPYNVIKCADLPRSWCDRDVLMFHSMFQLIVDFVELEQPFKNWDDKFKVTRFTNRIAMRQWIEYHYNTEEGIKNSTSEWWSEAENIRHFAETYKTYLKNIEILYLYEWYKDKKYELDEWTLSEKTGMKLVFADGKITHVLNGKPTLITGEEYFEIIKEHESVCDAMLERILVIRKYLWT